MVVRLEGGFTPNLRNQLQVQNQLPQPLPQSPLQTSPFMAPQTPFTPTVVGGTNNLTPTSALPVIQPRPPPVSVPLAQPQQSIAAPVQQQFTQPNPLVIPPGTPLDPTGQPPSAQTPFAGPQPTPLTPQTAPVGTAPVAPKSTIPTGLLGAEQALGAAGTGSIDALLQSLGLSRGDISQSGLNALTQLTGAGQAIQQGTQQGIGTVAGAGIAGLGEIGGGVSAGTQFLQGAQQQGLDFLTGATGQAVSPLTGFQQAGQQANQLQAALTGALGPEAQAEAFRNFQESPGQAFLREEQERAITRNAAAIGGVGGGRVRQELARQAAGRAEQAFGTRISQLAGISGQGLQAAGQIGQLFGTQGQVGANIIGQTGQQLAGLAETGGLESAQLIQNAGNQIANLAQTGAFAQADIGTKAAQIEQQTGTNLAQLAQTTGLNVSQVLQDLGSESAQLRTRAGEQIAQAIASTSTGLANLQAQQGAGLSDIVSQTGTTLANSLLQQGLLDADSTRQLATLLANIGVEGATTQAALSRDIADFEAAGVTGLGNAAQDVIAALLL